MRVEGTEEIKRVLRKAAGLPNNRRLMGHLKNETTGAISMVESRARELAPVKWGTLRGSGRTDISMQGMQFSATITFGGQASDYAAVQHRRRDFQHPKGGTHHYLYGERHSAWETKRDAVLNTLADELEKKVLDELQARGIG